jgi:hypothetical protein
MPEEFKISLTNNLIQAIGDYLITRPYKEVDQRGTSPRWSTRW